MTSSTLCSMVPIWISLAIRMVYERHTILPLPVALQRAAVAVAVVTCKVSAKHMWHAYKEDQCSVRFVCPHKFNKNIWRLINLLDLHFGMFVSANSYLTPAASQGFSPHYDDVDIFVMQTEGSKRWRLYVPRNQADILPQYSSRNYTQEEIGKEPVLDVILEEGDFLYAPRGTIHQCVSSEHEHSLHAHTVHLLEVILGRIPENCSAARCTTALRFTGWCSPATHVATQLSDLHGDPAPRCIR